MKTASATSVGRIAARPAAFFVNRGRVRDRLAALEGHSFAIGPPHGPPIVFVVRGGRVIAGGRGAKPEAVVRAPLRTFVAIWLGRLDPDAAFFQRKIEVAGSLKTAVIAKNVFDGLLR